MKACAREHEVIEAVAASRLDEPLRQHLLTCEVCAEAALVARALADDNDAAWAESAATPSADVVWFRAQLRARAEAASAASRPIFLVQSLGAACVVGLMAAVIGGAAWWLRDWTAWIEEATRALTAAPVTAGIAVLAARGILLALAVWLVLTPLAVYLAATEE